MGLLMCLSLPTTGRLVAGPTGAMGRDSLASVSLPTGPMGMFVIRRVAVVVVLGAALVVLAMNGGRVSVKIK